MINDFVSYKEKIKILFVGTKYHAGNVKNGLATDYFNYYSGIKNAEIFDIEFFDFIEPFCQFGTVGMQKILLLKIDEFNPKIIIFASFLNEFEENFFHIVRNKAKTLCVFWDDAWWQDLVLKWAQYFDAFTTSNKFKIEYYRKCGLHKAILYQFGINEKLFNKDSSIKQDIDVSFFGGWHPYREWIINKLKKNNLNVTVVGPGWKSDRVDINMIVNLLQRSKISLNISNCISYDIRYVFSSLRALHNTIRGKKNCEQLKGRFFEIPACGSLQITSYFTGLEDILIPGKEVIVYGELQDLFDKIYFYLENTQKRLEIATAGYNRIINNFTCSHLFYKIFKDLKLI